VCGVNWLDRLIHHITDRLTAGAEPDPSGLQDGDATPPADRKETAA
jgi:hypothetical protein